MRYLEVRRHSKRVRPGHHLSPWGIALARRLGAALGPFDQVVTSPLPRCVETAVAMGFAVQATPDALAGSDGLGETFPQFEQVDWAAGAAGLAALIQAGGPLAVFVAAQAALWREIALGVPDGGATLLIGHGGAFLSGAAIALVPDAVNIVGMGSSYCEGVRVAFDGEAVTQIERLRVEPAQFGLPGPDAS
jgi:broad specificity phosphatase PhoE